MADSVEKDSAAPPPQRRWYSGYRSGYTFDERGNVSQRLDKTGSIVSSDVYDAYGKATSTGGGDVYGFGGQSGYYTDSSNGLVLCTHRYYDPSTGRWLTRDPIGYKGGINLYGYVGNDPGNRWDPSGYVPIIVIYKLFKCLVQMLNQETDEDPTVGEPAPITISQPIVPPPDPVVPPIDPPVVDIPVIVCVPCIINAMFPPNRYSDA